MNGQRGPRLPEPLRYDVHYAQRGDQWFGWCDALGLEVEGRTLQLAQSALVEAARAKLKTLKDLPTPATASVQVYSEQLNVQPFVFQRLCASVAGMLPHPGPYVAEDDRLILRDSVVVVMDELGTTEAWKAKFEEEELATRHQLVTETHDWLVSKTGSAIESLVTYTDNLAYSIPVDPSDPAWTIFLATATAARYQLEMAVRGVLLRGGITCGKHHASSQLVAGPALIRAHEIESDKSLGPQVALSDEIVEVIGRLMRGNIKFVEPEYLQRLLLRDQNGRIFVDYLQAGRAFEIDQEPDEISIQRHRAAIEAGLLRHAGQPWLGKWVWAATYHNFIVSEGSFDDALMVRLPDHAASTTDHRFTRF